MCKDNGNNWLYFKNAIPVLVRVLHDGVSHLGKERTIDIRSSLRLKMTKGARVKCETSTLYIQ